MAKKEKKSDTHKNCDFYLLWSLIYSQIPEILSVVNKIMLEVSCDSTVQHPDKIQASVIL